LFARFLAPLGPKRSRKKKLSEEARNMSSCQKGKEHEVTKDETSKGSLGGRQRRLLPVLSLKGGGPKRDRYDGGRHHHLRRWKTKQNTSLTGQLGKRVRGKGEFRVLAEEVHSHLGRGGKQGGRAPLTAKPGTLLLIKLKGGGDQTARKGGSGGEGSRTSRGKKGGSAKDGK